MTALPEVLDSVSSFIARDREILIDGDWVPSASGETFEVENPATESKIASAARGGAEDIKRAVRAARQAFDDGPWQRINPSERGKLLWRLADAIEERADEFAQLENLLAREA